LASGGSGSDNFDAVPQLAAEAEGGGSAEEGQGAWNGRRRRRGRLDQSEIHDAHHRDDSWVIRSLAQISIPLIQQPFWFFTIRLPKTQIAASRTSTIPIQTIWNRLYAAYVV
jgi:hypothetical protein